MLALDNSLYPICTISDFLEPMREAWIVTYQELRNFYHHIRVKKGDQLKSTVRTRCGLFEYQVIPYSLTNTPAVFYASIDDCACSYISNFTTCNIDNVDIYSTGEMAYEDNIQNELQCLHHVGLHYNAVEWQLRAKELVILVIVIN